VTTLKAARAATATAVVLAVNDTTVTVYAFEPPVIAGAAVTVSTAGIRPTEWLLFVRLYVPDIQSEEGQDRIDDLTAAIDGYGGMPIGRLDWDMAFDEQKECFLMQAVATFPREDF
jgi:hypothetical protein